ncbi:hypothetical protein PPACK8108_LOCUS4636 [Phakopsora pachyrhizi]|uniref:Uncharacterized protein n=1 Tax=Phakopsora pachyrhizi TaxID=170000 RepID=A0AAV0ANS5_PHAPC|nr:hypothetical protein PPACK8108_LOCUS4636 [Phakopsora pachyrhizi]
MKPRFQPKHSYWPKQCQNTSKLGQNAKKANQTIIVMVEPKTTTSAQQEISSKKISPELPPMSTIARSLIFTILVAKSNFLRLVVNKRTKLLAIFLGKKNPSTGLYISRRDCHWVATPRPQYPVAAWLSHLSDEESSYSREKIRSTIRAADLY